MTREQRDRLAWTIRELRILDMVALGVSELVSALPVADPAPVGETRTGRSCPCGAYAAGDAELIGVQPDGTVSLKYGGIYHVCPPQAPPAPAADDILKSPVSSLGLSVRASRAMELLGIETLEDLCSHTGDELMIKNFGVSSRQEVVEKLAERGLRLRHPHERPGTIPPPLVTATTWAAPTELEAAVGEW